MSELSVAAELAASDAKVQETITSGLTERIKTREVAPMETPEVETPVVETQAETQAPASAPETPPPAETDPKLKRYAEREIELRRLEREIADKRASLSQEVAKAKEEAKLEFKKLLDEDADEFFKTVGMSYEDITRRMADKKPDPTTLKLKKEHEELRKKFEEKEREAEEAKTLALAEEARKQIHSYVDSSPKHALTKAAGWHDEVLNVIVGHYNDTGEELSEEAAADLVEAHLTGIVEKLLTVEAVRAKVSARQEEQDTRTPNKKTATLTNRQASTVPTRSNPDDELLDWEESIERAARNIRFKSVE